MAEDGPHRRELLDERQHHEGTAAARALQHGSFIYFGGNFTRVGRRFNDTLDELRIAPVALSADAIAVAHAATAGTLVEAVVREPPL